MLVNLSKKICNTAALSTARSVARPAVATALLSRHGSEAQREGKLQTRGYRHWWRCTPDEFALPAHSMPLDIKELIKV